MGSGYICSLMRILILDNYDSFTYNLYHYLQQFCDDITVLRNDEITPEETDAFTHIVLSPGPGLPAESGVLMQVLARQAERKPILGICLGMQAIALHFGGELFNQADVKHGVTTTISTTPNSTLFNGLPKSFTVGLYHSWAVKKENLPADLYITAKSTENVIMALAHKTLPVCGVQFHPESILTEHGKAMLSNWLAVPKKQPNNPMHGVKLAEMLSYLEHQYGWEGLGNLINIRCFQVDPSINSSLKFLRKTPWARAKVEQLYLQTKEKE